MGATARTLLTPSGPALPGFLSFLTAFFAQPTGSATQRPATLRWRHQEWLDFVARFNPLKDFPRMSSATPTTDATFTINPHLYNKLPYDAEKDFSPVTQLVSFSQMLVASANLPANNLKELLALAKEKPGALSYASYGPGSQPQLATEMLKQKAGVFIVHIPYRGIPQAVSAVVSGEVPLTWSGIVSARPHIASKRIKPIAYGGKTRVAAYPDVPTMTELGFPEVDANVWVGVFAPSSFAPNLVNRMNRDILAVISEPEFRSKEIEGKSYDYVGAGPEEFRRHIRSESVSRRATIKASGASLD